ncbi:MAG: ABC transporter ATP-binding protein [Thermodesulfobacteriota bacterium]
MSAHLLRAESLGFSYPGGKFSLSCPAFTVESGEIKGIIGPNGSGKSTLLSLLSGTMRPGKGKVTAFGRDLYALEHRERAALVGFLPQSAQADRGFFVEEVVSMGRYCRLSGFGFLSDQDLSVMQKVMEATEVSGLSGRLFGSLSGGERQRVLLSSVLAQEPKFLLLDEPTSALDLHHQAAFFNLLKNLAQQDMAIAVVTHDLNLASSFCTSLCLVARGKIEAEGPAEEILSSALLARVYGPGVEVIRHPSTGRPVVLPSTVVSLPAGHSRGGTPQ